MGILTMGIFFPKNLASSGKVKIEAIVEAQIKRETIPAVAPFFKSTSAIGKITIPGICNNELTKATETNPFHPAWAPKYLVIMSGFKKLPNNPIKAIMINRKGTIEKMVLNPILIASVPFLRSFRKRINQARKTMPFTAMTKVMSCMVLLYQKNKFNTIFISPIGYNKEKLWTQKYFG